MAVAIPPVVLVLDINALSVASPREWLEFSRVGSCVIPQVVYEEMRLLFDRSPDSDLERIAKAFNRFYPTSGWKISDADAYHPALKMGSSQALPRRTRVSLAVGRCAYGLAQSLPNSLVVLVTKDRSLQQRLYDIPSVNLTSVTGEALLQWSRSGQRPVAVSQKLQQFRTANEILPDVAVVNQKYRRTTPTRTQTQFVKAPTQPARRTASLPDWFPEVFSLFLAAAGLALAGYLIWFMLNSEDLKKMMPGYQQNRSSSNVDKPGQLV